MKLNIVNIIKTLNNPFPLESGILSNLKRALFVGIFIFIFFYIFQPFGLSGISENKKLLLFTGYSLLTVFSIFLPAQAGSMIFTDFFNKEKWKQIIISLIIIVIISSAQYFYSKLFFGDYIGFFKLLLYVVFIGLIPIIISVLFQYNYYLKTNLRISEEFKNQYIKKTYKNEKKHTELKTLTIYSDNKKEKINLILKDLLYIAAYGNYIKIIYLKDNNLKRAIIRNTFKKIVVQLNNNHNLFLCHRSYMVNTKKIESVEGNAQGLKLVIEKCKETVPVSRGYIKDFQKNLLK